MQGKGKGKGKARAPEPPLIVELDWSSDEEGSTDDDETGDDESGTDAPASAAADPIGTFLSEQRRRSVIVQRLREREGASNGGSPASASPVPVPGPGGRFKPVTAARAARTGSPLLASAGGAASTSAPPLAKNAEYLKLRETVQRLEVRQPRHLWEGEGGVSHAFLNSMPHHMRRVMRSTWRPCVLDADRCM